MKFLEPASQFLFKCKEGGVISPQAFRLLVRELSIEVLRNRHGFTPNKWRKIASEVLKSDIRISPEAKLLLERSLKTKENPAVELDHIYTVKEMVAEIKNNCDSPDSIAQILLKTKVEILTKEQHRLKTSNSKKSVALGAKC
jgi:hypothetical protein